MSDQNFAIGDVVTVRSLNVKQPNPTMTIVGNTSQTELDAIKNVVNLSESTDYFVCRYLNTISGSFEVKTFHFKELQKA